MIQGVQAFLNFRTLYKSIPNLLGHPVGCVRTELTTHFSNHSTQLSSVLLQAKVYHEKAIKTFFRHPRYFYRYHFHQWWQRSRMVSFVVFEFECSMVFLFQYYFRAWNRWSRHAPPRPQYSKDKSSFWREGRRTWYQSWIDFIDCIDSGLSSRVLAWGLAPLQSDCRGRKGKTDHSCQTSLFCQLNSNSMPKAVNSNILPFLQFLNLRSHV